MCHGILKIGDKSIPTRPASLHNWRIERVVRERQKYTLRTTSQARGIAAWFFGAAEGMAPGVLSVCAGGLYGGIESALSRSVETAYHLLMVANRWSQSIASLPKILAPA
jgi:hypothetical protein